MEEHIIIPLKKSSNRKWKAIGDVIHQKLVVEKLNNPLGYVLLLLTCIVLGAGIAMKGMVFGILVTIGIIAMPTVYAIVAYPRFGILVFLTMAYFIMFFLRLGVNFPLGTLMDSMEALFLLNLFIQQKKKKDWTIFKGSISTLILIWLVYNFIEFGNPAAESRLAWVYTVRSVGVVMITYFIFLYNITTKAFIKIIIKMWLGYALFAAAYAFKQEHVGFFPFEEAYLHSSSTIELLLFIGGVWRKFSIFSDPVVFAYTMVVSCMLCIGLLFAPLKKGKKVILVLLIFFYLLNMLYSGTRGAFVMPPAGLFLLAILKYNKKVLLLVTAGAVFLIVLISIPTSNQTLFRFQSAFKPSDDASFNVRKMNQKRIQPYIWTHPIGGGLGSTGEWGKKFAPYSYLANFPPDSGYVRVAVEMGWIGLFLLCTLMFTILKTGINNYFSIKDPFLKAVCLSMVLIVFVLNIGNYPQEALVQFPTNVYFYLVTALIVITKRLDNQQNEAANAQ